MFSTALPAICVSDKQSGEEPGHAAQGDLLVGLRRRSILRKYMENTI